MLLYVCIARRYSTSPFINKHCQTMKKLASIALMVPLVAWAILRIVSSMSFDVGCEGHMKRAADANTVPLAITEMEAVVAYADEHKLTAGYTSFFSFYRRPSKDVGFWYQNMKASLEELKSVKPDASSLEKSNILMKLRETLVDHGDSTEITYPAGLEIFPRNLELLFLAVLGILAAVYGVYLWVEDY